MSKIICDVCGTTYPETAAQCPICGCAKPGDAGAVISDTISQEEAGSTYTHVKGGRFSKSNVRKRNKGNQQSQARSGSAGKENISVREDTDDKGSNKGLMIAVIVLLLAVIAFMVFFVLRYISPFDSGSDQTKNTTPSTSAPTQAVSEEASVNCTALHLAETSVVLDEAGQLWLINVTPVPENTTDEIQYASSDESVATVNSEGCVTAVAPGQAIITITCGVAKTELTVDCVFIAENVDATTDETQPPETTDEATSLADPNAEYTVLFFGEWREDNDITLVSGESVEVTLEDDEGNEAKVTWEAEDPDVVEVDGSTFTAVSYGMTKVTAKYGNTTYTVIIRVW